MSTVNTMLPFLSAPWRTASGEPLPVRPLPPLQASAIEGLDAQFSGHLTPEFRKVLRAACGLEGSALGSIDFTGAWHPEEPLGVLRPCLTLAIDARNRRWIAETGRREGLPGPVWCIFEQPQVAVYVTEAVSDFILTLHEHTQAGSIGRWLHGLEEAAKRVWSHRGALAFHSRQACGSDASVRNWLYQLPRDARVYDLRFPHFGVGWPYGAAGVTSRLHRCGREPLFAVSGFPAPTQWADYLAEVAARQETPEPAAVRHARRAARTREVPNRQAA